jgi:uncharacterized protein YjdB
MVARIAPYKRGHYPTIEGNERIYFEDEFRKIEQTLSQVIEALNYNPVTKTIASGAITLQNAANPISLAVVDTESAASSDDLDTITSNQTGKILVVMAANSSRTVVLKDGTGNLVLEGDCTLDNAEDTITLLKTGDDWIELARSNNGS